MAMTLTRREVLAATAAGFAAAIVPPAFAAETGDDPYPLAPFDYHKLPEAYRPTVMAYKGRQQPGTVMYSMWPPSLTGPSISLLGPTMSV